MIDIEGSDFAILSSVEITFGDVPVGGDNAPLGSFSTSFEVPESEPGEYVVTATDGAGNSASADFTIVNGPPVAQDAELSAEEDEVIDIALSATDPDGDPLTFALENEPQHGTLSNFDANEGTVRYTPEGNYSGSDDFEFSVSDGSDDSKAKVSIEIAPVNDPPTAEVQSVSVDEGGEVEITLGGSDPEGEDLEFSITQEPEHGTLSGTGAELVYEPAAGYSGDDAFEFVASDGDASSEPALVGITVTAINEPPVAADVEAETDEDESVTVYLSANDPDSDDVTFAIESGAAHGSVSQLEQTGPMSATVLYRPQANYHGSDSFTFVVDDGDLESEVATATIDIDSVNDAPEVENQRVTLQYGERVEIMLAGSDVDGDELRFVIVEGPERGTLGSISSEDDESATVTYTPDPDEQGQDVFTFRASDGDAQSDIATVSITIPAPAVAPEEEPETPVQQEPDSSTAPGGGSSSAPETPAEGDDESSTDNGVPVPDATPDDVAQGAALQSLSTGTVVQGESFVNNPAAWLIPGALLGVASAVAFLGYREKSMKKGLQVAWYRMLDLLAKAGLISQEAAAKGPGRPAGWLPFSFSMNRIYGILNDEKSRAARKQIFDVEYGGAHVDQKEYENSKAVAKKQFDQIGSILRAKPELQEPFFDSFGEITVKVWWAIKEEVGLDGRKGMQWESLEWLGAETEKYWARQSSKDPQAS